VSEGRLRLRVITPTRVVVETDADTVTLPGALGELGILPGHAALLTTLRIGELAYRSGGREHVMAVQNGFAEVAADVVTVLADVAELPAEIDLEAARADKAAAEAALKVAGGRELDRQLAHLGTAVTRIAVASRR
jgi:F-type H+-transporting ATPase subunit epsilon